MSKFLSLVNRPGIRGGIAAIVLGAVLLAFSYTAVAQTISDTCGSSGCHNAKYQDWKASGHPYKLMKGDIAQNRPIPLPEGYEWDEISYVIGGYKWKSRYMDENGYIITQGKGEPGDTQYNYMTGEWVDYHADEENGTKPYDCGVCHTTNWVANPDPTNLDDNQGGLAGIWGTFDQGGIQCIQCHGSDHPGTIDNSAEACGECHYRSFPPGSEENGIPASGGWIKHHEQYNEFLASGSHGVFMECTTCHDPHKRAEFSIKESAQCGISCHQDKMASYSQTTMFDYDVTCEDCHMPMATKSGQVTAPHQGDVMTHIFRIDTDPLANMFTEDGAFVALDQDGNAAVTMDFACQKCHLTASLDELALFADDFHNPNKSLENFGIDPGLTGTWWNTAKGGEGFLLEVDANRFLYASFYTYAPDGTQAWLVAALTSADGTTANVTVYVPEGGTWGDPSGAVTDMEWGTGSFTFPTCTSASFTFTPNQAMMDLGYTAQSYTLERILPSGIACPTFVNNEMAAAAR